MERLRRFVGLAVDASRVADHGPLEALDFRPRWIPEPLDTFAPFFGAEFDDGMLYAFRAGVFCFEIAHDEAPFRLDVLSPEIRHPNRVIRVT